MVYCNNRLSVCKYCNGKYLNEAADLKLLTFYSKNHFIPFF